MKTNYVDNQLHSHNKDRKSFIIRFCPIFDRIYIKLSGLWTYITAYGKSVKDGYKSNAFSPLAWFCFFPIGLLVAIILIVKNNAVQYVCLGLIVLLIVFPLIMYVVLLRKDPKLLQSEWYRLEDKRLEMSAKGEEIKSVESESVTNVLISGRDNG